MKVVCPGSFDPITMGHVDVIERAAAHFDQVTVLVTANPNKNTGLFTVPERVELIHDSIDHLPNVVVDSWGGLLVDYTSAHRITALVKGLRSSLDYDYELPMAQMNRRLSGVDTFFLPTNEKYGYVSSTLCKEVDRYGGDLSGLLPAHVIAAMKAKRQETR
ncbi:pantetheine-phosphate adenylyltransferase [Corynebacterium uberis]|uniref:pantetheine-phosphate adenylyltransferase n=1 Tax=Corynebacterium TaxID=1716 RepID=UPI001D0B08DC|nr:MULTISPECIES: pantetheine-phosphate adenylyltransferase [Corynebacterium]MCZ9309139.1 pantetheine-phosphate adenylyltransferase [Corynebacterium sp. c6VSa_13]UDL74399.1 pantetheine-phosphate adenylyltransferase [Corynebacterium uberis]UDL76767.1 pantetheine-phosphate adenylyltransferase [Corynebacterium uberis]UDL78980.1 pantetheine-phosphate adenylyltransferase [Corynebacterium uberis]UDL81257.1 pantetheine-phosphate adenylyltransferase [Corynebacterium uberis]